MKIQELSKEDVLEAVQRSGYLFEQEVANFFEDNGYHVYPNEPFKDIDEGKSREIDIMAYKRLVIADQYTISVRFIIECKNNSNPFVFIKRNKNQADSKSTRNILFPTKDLDEKIFKFISTYNFNTTSNNPDAYYKHIQFCKITRNGSKIEAQHSGVIDGIVFPIIKSLNFYIDREKNFGGRHISIIIPLVIFNSKLYEIDSTVKTPNICDLKFVTFSRKLDSAKIKGLFHIDFVNFNSLKEYLEVCTKSNISKFELLLNKIEP